MHRDEVDPQMTFWENATLARLGSHIVAGKKVGLDSLKKKKIVTISRIKSGWIKKRDKHTTCMEGRSGPKT